MATSILATHNEHRVFAFLAMLLGIVTTFAIYTYSIDNLETLGLAPELKRARTLETIVFIFGEVFLSLAIGRFYKNNPALAHKLMAVWVLLLVVDFWGSYQARNAIALHQTINQTNNKEHAGLIAKQLEVNQTAAKELSDASARQRANKMITGSAQTAMQASKQADSGLALIEQHATAMKAIKPTEADTFGSWSGTVIFLAVLSLYALNSAMWGLVGDLSHTQMSTSLVPERVRNEEPATPQIDLEKAREAVKSKNAMPAIKYVLPVTLPLVAPAHAQNLHTQTSTNPVSVQVRTNESKARTEEAEKLKYALLLKNVTKEVQEKRLKPSIAPIREYAVCGQGVAERLIVDMLEAGTIKKCGRGWKAV